MIFTLILALVTFQIGREVTRLLLRTGGVEPNWYPPVPAPEVRVPTWDEEYAAHCLAKGLPNELNPAPKEEHNYCNQCATLSFSDGHCSFCRGFDSDELDSLGRFSSTDY